MGCLVRVAVCVVRGLLVVVVVVFCVGCLFFSAPLFVGLPFPVSLVVSSLVCLAFSASLPFFGLPVLETKLKNRSC